MGILHFCLFVLFLRARLLALLLVSVVGCLLACLPACLLSSKLDHLRVCLPHTCLCGYLLVNLLKLLYLSFRLLVRSVYRASPCLTGRPNYSRMK